MIIGIFPLAGLEWLHTLEYFEKSRPNSVVNGMEFKLLSNYESSSYLRIAKHFMFVANRSKNF